MKILVCNEVSIRYESNVALCNCSFEVDAGNFFGIFGENGSGKSSLLKCIAGLMKPSSGSINFNNIKKNEIGYMAQFANIKKDFPASVYEVVLSGTLCKRRHFYFYGKNDKKLADKNLELLGIEKLKNKSFQELSGGQRQRVLLSRMLCAEAKLLLLDEPATGLDEAATKQLYSILKQINEQNITIIMVSHDVQCATGFCDNVLQLKGHHGTH